jgi:hypothetical protein
MSAAPLSGRPKILADLTAANRLFAERLALLTDAFSMKILQRRFPDGVTPLDLAALNAWTFEETLSLIAAAEGSGALKVRRAPAGHVRFVWLPGTVPPLTSSERRVLAAARRDLRDGPAEIWMTGAAHDLGLATATVVRALDFLVSADLLSRNGKVYTLTDLGQEEPA